MARSTTVTSLGPLLALVGACAATDDPSRSHELPAEWAAGAVRAPTIPVLAVELPELGRLETVRIAISGAEPGERVGLALSAAGIGPGGCPPPLGGLCLELTNANSAGSAVADASGRAAVHLWIPWVGLGNEICFQAFAARGPGGVDSELSEPVCGLTVDRSTYLNFTTLGTFTTPVLELDAVTITGSADIHVLDFNGLGVVGGYADSIIDGFESMTFTFDAPRGRVDYNVQMAADIDGDGILGASWLEPFDETGRSLGVYFVWLTGNKYLADYVGNVPISSFTVTAEVDHIRISSLSFYPAPLEAPADSDFDGLSDEDEIGVYGTNPALADTDCDGLSDGDEVLVFGTDPTVADPDADGDGLADLAETAVYGTDPLLADTDMDGLSDSDELLVYDTDPLDEDSDDDTVSDAAEVLVLGTDPAIDERSCDGGIAELSTTASGAKSVYAADLDGDGDDDALSASQGDDTVAWYENLGGGRFGPAQVIAEHADGPVFVLAADVDADGDNDVLSASKWDNTVAWYPNLGDGTFDVAQVISAGFDGPYSVDAADLDGDGDDDVLVAFAFDDLVGWFENLGGGTFGPVQAISATLDGPFTAHASDLDGDGDDDVISGSHYDDTVVWYENLGGVFGPVQVIGSGVDGVWQVGAADIDGNGHVDVLSASYGDDTVAWYENLGGGAFGIQRVITAMADGARSVQAADMDGDGDLDVLSASEADDTVAWHENLGDGESWVEHTITSDADGAHSVWAADLHDDGSADDVLWASSLDDTVAMWPLLPHDDDSDGLTRDVEVCIAGTDPYIWDTDGGGAGDGEELDALTHPLDPTDDL